jgi:Zn finger protein HypA/HybF involved in hydrogenase expression
MHVAALIQGIGSIGFFASRAFLPAFVTALLLRFGPDIPVLAHTGFFGQIEGAPTWFTHGLTITILGVLAGLELAATKYPEPRQLLDEIDEYLKTGMSVVTFFGVISVADAEIIKQVAPAMAPGQAGFGDYLFTAVVAAGVYVVSASRQRVLGVLVEADEDDDLGIQKLISWAEDIWVVAGLVMFVLFPVLMLILIGIVAGLLMLSRKYAEYREEKSKIACTSCEEMIYQSAMACPSCKAAVESPRRIGMLGQSKPQPAVDLDAHRLRLVEKKRCPVCATRFTQRVVHQTCSACGHDLMADPRFAQRYLDHIARRVPGVLVVCLLLSLIPVIGLIPGVIYYRVALVAPFRRYLPMGRRMLLKWGIRILLFVLIAFQWVPLLGGAVVPIMALISYTAYRSSYRALVQTDGAAGA